MKTEFKREMNRNYMVLHPEKEIGGSYALRMLSENRINGLLPFQEKRIDGETFLYFNHVETVASQNDGIPVI